MAKAKFNVSFSLQTDSGGSNKPFTKTDIKAMVQEVVNKIRPPYVREHFEAKNFKIDVDNGR